MDSNYKLSHIVVNWHVAYVMMHLNYSLGIPYSSIRLFWVFFATTCAAYLDQRSILYIESKGSSISLTEIKTKKNYYFRSVIGEKESKEIITEILQ